MTHYLVHLNQTARFSLYVAFCAAQTAFMDRYAIVLVQDLLVSPPHHSVILGEFAMMVQRALDNVRVTTIQLAIVHQ
jgi:hypothetical protein